MFPGVHESLHWGYEDPAEATGTDEERLAVFRRVFIQLGERINQFVPLALRERRERSRDRGGVDGRLSGYPPGLMELYLLRHAHAGDPARVGRPGRAPATLGQGREAGGSTRPVPGRDRVPVRRHHHVAQGPGRADGEDRRRAARAARSARTIGSAGEVGIGTLEAILRDAGDPARPVIVGHDPDFTELVAILCGAARVPMKKGALARIDVARPLAARWRNAPLARPARPAASPER